MTSPRQGKVALLETFQSREVDQYRNSLHNVLWTQYRSPCKSKSRDAGRYGKGYPLYSRLIFLLNFKSISTKYGEAMLWKLFFFTVALTIWATVSTGTYRGQSEAIASSNPDQSHTTAFQEDQAV